MYEVEWTGLGIPGEWSSWFASNWQYDLGQFTKSFWASVSLLGSKEDVKYPEFCDPICTFYRPQRVIFQRIQWFHQCQSLPEKYFPVFNLACWDTGKWMEKESIWHQETIDRSSVSQELLVLSFVWMLSLAWQPWHLLVSLVLEKAFCANSVYMHTRACACTHKPQHILPQWVMATQLDHSLFFKRAPHLLVFDVCTWLFLYFLQFQPFELSTIL